MRNMLIGCALLMLGSGAALAQTDPAAPPASPPAAAAPAAPAPAPAATPAAPEAAATPVHMKKPGGMHHRRKAMMHKHMMHRHRMMRHRHHGMRRGWPKHHGAEFRAKP